MKKKRKHTPFGVDTLLCACAGGVVGFILGGIAPTIIGLLLGAAAGYLLEIDMKKLRAS